MMGFVLFSVSCGSSGDGVVVMFLFLVFSLVRRAGCMQRFLLSLFIGSSNLLLGLAVVEFLHSGFLFIFQALPLKRDSSLEVRLWIMLCSSQAAVVDKSRAYNFQSSNSWIFLHPLSSECSWK
ncbi:unnamed protein product [Brassica oleracea var. botrytis]|uniref:Uncharacterized protein n=1 Tax=Brassica oleracea TaxID=3712 RepID=A0A3P6CXL2_BRAOL|nr:unnamed protein product [Brassica oleracea]